MATEGPPDGEVPTEGIHQLIYVARILHIAGLIGPTGFLGLKLTDIDWEYFNKHPIHSIGFYPNESELVCLIRADSRILYGRGREERRIDLPQVMFIFEDGIKAVTELSSEDQSIIADYIRGYLATYAWLCVKRMGEDLGSERALITQLKEFWDVQRECDEP